MLQGMTVLRIWRGAIYVRIDTEDRRPIQGGCDCQFCRDHPHLIPSWDTLGIPLDQGARSWTVHAPEWSSADKIKPADRLPTPGRL